MYDLPPSTQYQQAFYLAFTSILSKLVVFIPQLIAALGLIFVGYLVAGWCRWLVVKILKGLRLSSLIHHSPLEEFLKKAEITAKIEDLLGRIVKWLIWLVFIISALNLLGLTTVSLFLTNILGYIPNIIAAAIILMIGTVIAGLVESLIKSSFSAVSRSTARLVSKLGSYVVMVFTLLAAFAQLGIAQDLINALFVGFVAMLALGFGLAFGLGAKDIVAKILDEWYENLKKDNK